jgi:hypothetical protein
MPDKNFVAIALCATILASLAMGSFAKEPQDQTAITVISNAIQAHGGKQNLSRMSPCYFQAKGVIYALDPNRHDSFPASLEYWHQAPDRTKYILSYQLGDQRTAATIVFDGQHVWKRSDDKTEDKGQVGLEAMKQAAYVSKVKRLFSLAEENSFVLVLCPDADVTGRAAKVV